MDLICIRRKYRNVRKTVTLSFIITMLIYVFLAINHVYAGIEKEKNLEVDYAAISKAIEEQKLAEELEQERIKASILTEEKIQKLNSIYKSDTKRVFLTFDDGPSKSVTVPILDYLKQENIKANFFVLGSRVDLYPDIVKRAYKEGHYIANHGYSHKYSEIYESAQSVLDEYNKTNEAVKRAIGNPIYNTNIFRFPGGSVGGTYNQIKSEAKQLLEQNKIVSIDWNALNGDAEGLQTEEQLVNRLKETVQNKNSVVILMHDTGNKNLTYNSLPQIIEYLRQEGYEFKTFYDI